MRKWIALSLLLIVVLIAVAYFALPATVAFDKRTVLPVTTESLMRTALNEKNWTNWWPGEKETASGAGLFYHGRKYRVLEKRYSSLLISVTQNSDSLQTELVILPNHPGGAQLAWLGKLQSTGFLSRFSTYFKSRSLQSDLASLLEKMQAYYSSPERIYGMSISEGLVTDSLLISTARRSKTPLSTDSIYAMIDRLKTFAQNREAKQTGAPMLNIFTDAESNLLTRVALPINKRLQNEGEIEFKWMLGNGNILIAEVKGGPWQIEQAFAQMQLFINDNRRTAPAIEFQSLITDRRAEKDTSQWVTKLYWPVM